MDLHDAFLAYLLGNFSEIKKKNCVDLIWRKNKKAKFGIDLIWRF